MKAAAILYISMLFYQNFRPKAINLSCGGCESGFRRVQRPKGKCCRRLKRGDKQKNSLSHDRLFSLNLFKFINVCNEDGGAAYHNVRLLQHSSVSGGDGGAGLLNSS